MTKLSIASACAVFSLSSFFSCSGPATNTAKHVVIVGDLIARTGDSADESYSNAANLAHDDFAAALEQTKFKDLQIDMLVKDSQSSVTGAPQAALAALDGGAKAILMDSSRIVQAVMRLDYDTDTTNDLGLPTICGSCSSEDLNNPNYNGAKGADGGLTDPALQALNRNEKKWLWTGQMNTKLQSKILAQLIIAAGDVNGDGKKKLSGLQANDTFGNSTTAAVVAELNARDAGFIIERVPFDSTQSAQNVQFATLMQKVADDQTETFDNKACGNTGGLCNPTGTPVADGKPDITTCFVSLASTAAANKERKNQNTPFRMLHAQPARAQSVIESLGSGVANDIGFEGTSHILFEPGEQGDVVKNAYMTKYSVTPGYRVSTYYDDATVLFLAIAIAVKDLADPSTVTPQQINDAMKKTSDPAGEKVIGGTAGLVKALNFIKEGKAINYEGASGPMDFDANQTPRNKLVQWKYQSTGFVDLASFDCVASDACTQL